LARTLRRQDLARVFRDIVARERIQEVTGERYKGESDSGLMEDLESEWQCKGATLSDKTAREEFGLTQDEIVRAIRAGQLRYREGSMYGNPWLRLLRREVEALVRKNHGDMYLMDRQAKTELARINRELKRLKTQMAGLEERRSKLIAGSRK
jgi:hypothetical protein